MKLLLHACCGPCSLEPTRLLKAAGHDITIYYANSNIHPAEEYEHRLATLRAWAADAGFEVLEGPYDPATWEACAGRIGDAAIAEIEQARAKAGVEGECAGEREGEPGSPDDASSNRCKTVTETNHEDVSPDGAPLSASSAS
ncbi:epoxyqueuosine reductase QueH, partial [Senegalimassilia anaerobia]|uniref:epoxyqueuosine reductase QueH n=1 Tax=Senegalimassilia anaerobia TaxID=1473216 RepID=UPI00248DCD5C